MHAKLKESMRESRFSNSVTLPMTLARFRSGACDCCETRLDCPEPPCELKRRRLRRFVDCCCGVCCDTCSGAGVLAMDELGDMMADWWCGCGPPGWGEKRGEETEGC